MGLVSFVPQGRMGNFYMTAFTVYAYCRRHGLEFSVPSVTSSEKWSPIYAKHLIHPEYRHPFYAHVHLKETEHCYIELPFKEEWRLCNVLCDGYFQSEKYFLDFREDILKDFKFKWELYDDCVSLHIRLTDYVLHKNLHHNISDEYLANAIQFFADMGFKKFMVFSDEINVAKERVNDIVYPNMEFIYSEGKDEETDLYLGSCCRHNIIAASTFSWFQAWLGRNEDKIVIAPKTWFEGANKRHAEYDIIPERWIKM